MTVEQKRHVVAAMHEAGIPVARIAQESALSESRVWALLRESRQDPPGACQKPSERPGPCCARGYEVIRLPAQTPR